MIWNVRVLLLGPNADVLIPVVGSDVAVIDDEPLTVDTVRTIAPRVVVSYGYRHIISAEVIDAVDHSIVNLHISMLPWNRGADPNLWSWLTNTPKGVTVHRLTAGVDEGPIIAQEPVILDPARHTLRSSYRELSERMVEVFASTWPSLSAGTAADESQKGIGSVHRSADKDRYADALTLGWDTPCASVAEYGRRNDLWIRPE